MSVYGKAVRSALETEGFTYFSPDENERRYDPLDCTMMEERPPGATRNIITRLAETCKLPLIQVWEQDAECAMRTCRSPFAVGCGMGAAWAYRRVACEEAYSTQVAEVNMISEAFMTKSIIIEPDLTKTTLQQCPLKQLATMCGIGACVAFACDIFCSSSAVADSVGFKPKEEGQGCRRGGSARAHRRGDEAALRGRCRRRRGGLPSPARRARRGRGRGRGCGCGQLPVDSSDEDEEVGAARTPPPRAPALPCSGTSGSDEDSDEEDDESDSGSSPSLDD